LVSGYFDHKVLNNWTQDKYDWEKEIVVITGGAGGIGGQVVKLMAERGTKVVVLDVIPMTFEAPKNVFYYKCDITSPATLAAVAKEIRKDVGEPTGKRGDGAEPLSFFLSFFPPWLRFNSMTNLNLSPSAVLINNAGVARGKNILDATEKDVRFTFDVNTLAHYWTAKEFVPAMVAANHGMVVTVASFAAYMTVPNMTDYGASKAAALSFHEGLTAELKTRYDAPKVRTIVVNQGYTKTPLFDGYHNDSPFLVPALEPDTVAEAIVQKVWRGCSGQLILPGFGVTLAFLRGFPHWYQVGLRAKGANIMTKWKGRQVIDLDKWKSNGEKEGSESA
jgi:NAD(P)-dependent dehydrogenase (short-subunit alcohol dehydrogenase family)